MFPKRMFAPTYFPMRYFQPAFTIVVTGDTNFRFYCMW